MMEMKERRERKKKKKKKKKKANRMLRFVGYHLVSMNGRGKYDLQKMLRFPLRRPSAVLFPPTLHWNRGFYPNPPLSLVDKIS